MKIAMIGQKGMPSQFGGVEKHVEELSVRLVQQPDIDVVAYTRSWYTSSKQKQFNGVRLQSLPSIHSKHFDAITHTALSIIHAAFVERADIIHIHAVGPALLTGLARILRPQAKVVVTFHCIDRQHQKWGRFARFMLWLGELQAAWFAHEVISVSRTLQAYMYEVYGRSGTYIPNGISAVQPVPASVITQQFGLEKDSYVVAVARLVRHKGIQYLIEAYNNLQTDKQLVIVGGSMFDDSYEKELKQLAADNPNIIFTGNQTGRALQELFSNAYCYVLPSESEGLPISLLEAASYGKAVLASDIPANVEITRECGMQFINKNVEDLTEKLEAMLRAPEVVEKVGKQARKYVLEHYHWDNIASDTIRLYTAAPQPRAKLVSRPLGV